VTQPADDGGLESFELVDVAFFPQTRFQCGPAALATVLVESGVAVSPQDLVPEVYLPERRGSLQIEIKASARRHGRIPYRLPPDVETLLAEVAAGSPVMVLQNMGLSWMPRWHYAVVIGWDAQRREVLLRSGRARRRSERLEDFVRSWSLAENWALRILRPGELPVHGTPDRYLQAVIDSEGSLTDSAIRNALEEGTDAWPDYADLSFAFANLLRLGNEFEKAAGYYRKALESDGEHLGSLNNYADLLLDAGCKDSARLLIERALPGAGTGPLLAVLQATQAEIDQAQSGVAGPHCEFLSPDVVNR